VAAVRGPRRSPKRLVLCAIASRAISPWLFGGGGGAARGEGPLKKTSAEKEEGPQWLAPLWLRIYPHVINSGTMPTARRGHLASRIEEENESNRNRGRGENTREDAVASRRSHKNWKNSCALFARNRQYIFALVRELHYYILLKTRFDEMDSTKTTNNSRLISILARRSRSLFHESFLRLHSFLCESTENDGLGI